MRLFRKPGLSLALTAAIVAGTVLLSTAMVKEKNSSTSYSNISQPQAPPKFVKLDVNFESNLIAEKMFVVRMILGSKTSQVTGVSSVANTVMFVINNLDRDVLISSTDVNNSSISATFLTGTAEVGLTRTPITLNSLMLSKVEFSKLSWLTGIESQYK